MSAPKIAKARWGTCLRQVFTAIGLLIIFFTVVIGLTVISFSLPAYPHQRSGFIFWGVMLVVFVTLLVILIWGIFTTRGRASKLNAAFSPLGFVGRPYLLNGRQYHGVINGSQVDVYYYRGPSLDIYVSSSMHSRMGTGSNERSHRPPSYGPSLPSVNSNSTDFSHLIISCLDERWGRELLDNPQAREIIQRVTGKQTELESRSVIIRPEAIQLQVSRVNAGSLTPDQLHRFMDDLFVLVNIIDTFPDPEVTINQGPLEHRAGFYPSGLIIPVLIPALAVIIFFAFLITLIIVAFIFQASGG